MQIKIPPALLKYLLYAGVGLFVLIVAGVTFSYWTEINAGIKGIVQSQRPKSPAEGEDAHAGHEHTTTTADSLELSEQAMKNIGLTPEMIKPVKLASFQRTVDMPAMIVPLPGRTHMSVPVHFTGVVIEVRVVDGQAVRPGMLLFRVRLTHEDLVSAQTEFLATLEARDVEQKEVARLAEVADAGGIAKKSYLEKQYELGKLEAKLKAQREALSLHHITPTQIKQIEEKRSLLRELSIFAPAPGEPLSEPELTHVAIDPQSASDAILIAHDLKVTPGQAVTAGETLCILSDLSELYIRGQAFEQDLQKLNRLMRKPDWSLTALFEETSGEVRRVENLKIAYISNEVDAESRSLYFYVPLVNTLLTPPSSQANLFVNWQYRLGERLKLRVPVEEWEKQIVLPLAAVAQDGAESYVFLQNGKKFNRVAVHVKYRGSDGVVVANDGSIFPGDVVALTGAHQMQMHLKNQSGGGVDPHAGHTH